MTQNKKLGLITLLLFFPSYAKAFIDFCFPISFTILYYILGIPGSYALGLINEIFPLNNRDLLSDSGSLYTMLMVGYMVDLAVILILGYLVDKNKNLHNLPLRKKYIFKAPLYFAVGALLLFGLMFIDPTCS